jgi:putative component of membrane protein insertase Oxa1/YidC/SpoIIIJ protein YidD
MYQPAKSQLKNDLAFAQEHTASKTTRTNYSFSFTAASEYEFVAKFAFTFYKKYISSQDAISCTFEPSCSVFGLHAIQNFGVMRGILATFDRLTRCHGWNQGYYRQEPVTGLNYDPIEHYHAH